MKQTVLIVDDEKHIREIISLFLREENFNILEAENGVSAFEYFSPGHPSIDLVILDILLPDIDGFEVCKRIREVSDVPIIFLSALNDDDYFLLGYRSGADDYISKPFKATILTAKVKSILTREASALLRSPSTTTSCVVIDHSSHECFVDGKKIQLTNKEYALLSALMGNPGRVLSREYLLSSLWGYDFIGQSRVVDNHIKNIRKKLGKYSHHIKTVISVGYKYDPN